MRHRLRVYVAASSNELARAKWAIKELRELGHVVTHDWPAEVESVGSANPPDARETDRVIWADGDLVGIEEADVFWLLMPEAEGFGAGVELGYALAMGHFVGGPSPRVVCSGPVARSIFTALADKLYIHDCDALYSEFHRG